MIYCPQCALEKKRADDAANLDWRLLTETIEIIKGRQIIMLRAQCLRCNAQVVVEQIARQDEEGTWHIEKVAQ